MLSAQASPTSHLKTKEDRLSAAAILNFFGMTEEWGIDSTDQIIILGPLPQGCFQDMKNFAEGKHSEPAKLSKDTLERISYIMGIYKALNILLPNARRAAEWIRKSNSAVLFDGKSALDLMLQGDTDDFANIRRYLDAERGL
ncbi:hypothetical protein A9Q99_04490 [Gammaproteobacteria bacterium 45_16_T64]|nr:hypothetical protein A9Q99_04490 [Gammaproteobacteria bacterium 45_16_T64]